MIKLPEAPVPRMRAPTLEVSIVMPCLNEAETLAGCIREAQAAIAKHALSAEIIVADNGSTDGSIEIAEHLGARVVKIAPRGYGSALAGGIAAAAGRYVVMADSDLSYDFGAIYPFIERLRTGVDVVMGNRFQGRIEPGAMPWSHRWIGNPVLSWLGRLFFDSRVGDFHCGLRAFNRRAINRLGLRTTGMEFASEMVVKASLHGLRIVELPTILRKDGRSRPPHLKTWQDGWRHLRFMLLFSPRWLFLIPGLTLLCLGGVGSAVLVAGPLPVGAVVLDVHSLLVAGVACLLGFQVVVFAAFTKVFAMREGLHPVDPKMVWIFRHVKLEAGLLLGATMTLLGIAGLMLAAWSWSAAGFGGLDPRVTMREVIPATVLLALGVQAVFASFFLSILGIPTGTVGFIEEVGSARAVPVHIRRKGRGAPYARPALG